MLTSFPINLFNFTIIKLLQYPCFTNTKKFGCNIAKQFLLKKDAKEKKREKNTIKFLLNKNISY